MSGLFGQKPSGPARMPDTNDPAILEAQRRKRAEVMGRSGRTATILSRGGSGGSPGTGAYKNSLLGQGG